MDGGGVAAWRLAEGGGLDGKALCKSAAVLAVVSLPHPAVIKGTQRLTATTNRYGLIRVLSLLGLRKAHIIVEYLNRLGRCQGAK